MFGGATTNPYDDIVTKTTDENLTSENWELIMNLCDKVQDEGQEGAKNVIAALLKRMAHRNPNVQLYALSLSESLSKNCSVELHREIASRAFTQGLEKIITDRTSHDKVRKRALGLIAMWTAEFENDTTLGIMEECYDNLKAKAYTFDAPSEPPPPTVDDEIRRKEEEELQRVLEMSMQDTGGRDKWANYGSAPGGPSGSGSGSTSNLNNSSSSGYTAATPTASSGYSATKYAGGYVPAEAQPRSPSPIPAATTPSSYSTPAPATTVASNEPSTLSIVTRVRALHTFEPSEPGELAFDKGDIIKVVDRGYKDWWRGQLKGRTGIFPVNYVEPCPEPTKEEVALEAEKEAAVFSQAVNVEKLLEMLKSLDPNKDNLADNEEIQDLYRSCMALRPKIVKLIDKYSQKRADLVSMNETFVRARSIFDRVMEESLARTAGGYGPGYGPQPGYGGPPYGYQPPPSGYNAFPPPFPNAGPPTAQPGAPYGPGPGPQQPQQQGQQPPYNAQHPARPRNEVRESVYPGAYAPGATYGPSGPVPYPTQQQPEGHPEPAPPLQQQQQVPGYPAPTPQPAPAQGGPYGAPQAAVQPYAGQPTQNQVPTQVQASGPPYAGQPAQSQAPGQGGLQPYGGQPVQTQPQTTPQPFGQPQQQQPAPVQQQPQPQQQPAPVQQQPQPQQQPVQVQSQHQQQQLEPIQTSLAAAQDSASPPSAGPPYVYDPTVTYADPNVQAWAQYYAQGGKDLAGAVYFISVPGVKEASPDPGANLAAQASAPATGSHGAEGQTQLQSQQQSQSQSQTLPHTQSHSQSFHAQTPVQALPLQNAVQALSPSFESPQETLPYPGDSAPQSLPYPGDTAPLPYPGTSLQDSGPLPYPGTIASPIHRNSIPAASPEGLGYPGSALPYPAGMVAAAGVASHESLPYPAGMVSATGMASHESLPYPGTIQSQPISPAADMATPKFETQQQNIGPAVNAPGPAAGGSGGLAPSTPSWVLPKMGPSPKIGAGSPSFSQQRVPTVGNA